MIYDTVATELGFDPAHDILTDTHADFMARHSQQDWLWETAGRIYSPEWTPPAPVKKTRSRRPAKKAVKKP